MRWCGKPSNSCREGAMNLQRTLLLLGMLMAAASPASGQQTASAAGQANSGSQGAVPAPDFSGIWRHGSLPWFVPPASGPGPVTNRSRRKDNGVSNYGELVGDYTNPILQPWAADVVKKKGELSLAGVTYPNPANQCWPEPVPFIYKNFATIIFQKPDHVTILYEQDHEVRQVKMNVPHPKNVKPSWYGDSVGHYEGDTLVVDTVGIKVGPHAMVDWYGTPRTSALHVVERYRLIDYDRAKEGLDRDFKENFQVQQDTFAPDYKGKHLQLEFTVEDEGVFTMPWSATMTYRPQESEWLESICAENFRKYGTEKDAQIPTANKPDF